LLIQDLYTVLPPATTVVEVLESVGADDISLIRARFNELLCERVLDKSMSSECFTAGMFSLLDTMLDQPMGNILKELNLSEDVCLALLRLDSPLRSIVELAVAMEIGDWDAIGRLTRLLGIEEAEAFRLHTESIAWANQMQHIASESD
jgi:EAL and modified HD-GYP domain-containing signal transduction protein